MKKTVLLGLFVSFSAIVAQACINVYYGVDDHGDLHKTERTNYERKLNKNFNLEQLETKLLDLEPTIKEDQDYKALNDYAATLMKIGQFEESLELLKSLYQAYPEEYQIAANLGTSYELNGEVDSAYKYIERGMELNPDAHGGSEWIHIKVLEAKQEIAKDSLWLESNTVLGLTEEQEMDEEVADQLWIQITERFPFTPEDDPIMASLMVDLGDCWMHEAVEYGRAFYQIAVEYHADSSEATLEKYEQATSIMNDFENVRPDRREHPRHEMHQRIGYTNYQKMMDDNNVDNYEPNWETINLNVDSLLSYVGLEKIIEVEDETLVNEGSYYLDTGDEKKSDSLIYWLLGGGVLVMIGMFFFLRKR